jgi:hypothetical protein
MFYGNRVPGLVVARLSQGATTVLDPIKYEGKFALGSLAGTPCCYTGTCTDWYGRGTTYKNKRYSALSLFGRHSILATDHVCFCPRMG